jgi:hypothetical protein
MKVYTAVTALNGVPYELRIVFGKHAEDCKDEEYADCSYGGGYATFGKQQISVGSHTFATTLLHEIVEMLALLQDAHYVSNGGKEEPMIIMDHTKFTNIIDNATWAFVEMMELITDNFEQDGMGSLSEASKKCAFELTHVCGTDVKKPKKVKVK